MEAINTWLEGMNQDMSKLLAKSDTYLHAKNLRPVTELGESSGALEQIRGNNYELTIPNVWNVYKLIVNLNNPTPLATTITVMGNTTSSFNVGPTTSGLDLYNQLSSLPGFNSNFFAAYEDNSIVIWATSITSPIDPNVTFTGGALFYGNNGVSPNIYIDQQSDLIPIGNAFIRDKYYLFTCNNTLPNPGGHDPDLPSDPSQVGQIWEMEYNYSGSAISNTIIKLIYTNYLDFTLAHPIPPTGTEGRYENDVIQRIYWTDNFNKPRALNVVNPNIMANPPSQLNIVPDVDFSIPILQSVNTGGSLKAGVYQAAYRLTNIAGAKTNYSLPSNIVQIAGGGVSDSTPLDIFTFRDYVGNNYNDTVPKRITWQINGVDTNYDNIEIIILRRQTFTDTPEIYNIINDIIPLNGTYRFTYIGNEDTVPVDYEEYLTSTSLFTHCKTISTKDNILFAGNIRNTQAELDFDARAYRFDGPLNPQIKLVDGQGTISYYNAGNMNTIPETYDAINPDQDIYKFQSDGSTIGGEGPNIKYNFGTVEIPYDSNPLWENGPAFSPGFKFSQENGPFNTNITNTAYSDGTYQNFPMLGLNHGNKLPYETHLFRGYKRNETYRFGIQFYDKQKNPYYVKWIADIKMPNYSDTNTNVITQNNVLTTGTFKLSDVTSAAAQTNYPDNGVSTFQLYVQFQVTIPPNILSKISGYSIVRVERKKDDMTILGQGMVIPFEYRGIGTSGPEFEVPGAIREPWLHLTLGGNTDALTYLCPDWMLMPGLYPGYSSVDKLNVIGRMETVSLSGLGAYQNAGTFTPPLVDKYYQLKTYVHNTNITSSHNISLQQYFPRRGVVTNPATGNVYYNDSSYDPIFRDASKIECDGNNCHLLFLNNPINLSLLGTFLRKYVADYVRSGVVQYGGNTYNLRSQNEYILTGHFRSVKDANSSITDFTRVFGGDTWVNIYDSQKLIKHWATHLKASNIYSSTVYFPVETRVNLPLRQGSYMAYNFNGDDGNGASGDETFVYNDVYSNENNVVKFYPKPLTIIETDNWDNRIVYSSIKINGEASDSWTSFLASNYWDVEGSYGPINSLIRLKNEIYCIQDRGFSKILINPVAMTNTGDGLPVVLGTGLTIQRHIYIGIDAGSMHQWSVSASPSSIMFVDAQKSRVYLFKGDRLEAITDTSNWSFLNKELIYGIINNDNPSLDKGIITTFDHENSEYLITFLNTNTDPEYTKKSTLVYNEVTNKFTSFYSFTPNLYINNNRSYYTYNKGRYNNELYIHNKGDIGKFYGVTPDVELKLIMNNQPSITKVLDNLVWHTEAIEDLNYPISTDDINMFPETWNSIRIYNDYQNTDTITLDPITAKNIRRVERSWQLQVPRNKVLYSTSASPNIFTDLGNKTYGERMRDKTFTIELKYSNPNNYRFIMHYLKSIFRVSFK